MKPIRIAAAVLTVTIAFAGCKNRDEKPIPAPNAQWTTVALRTPSTPTPGVPSGTKGLHEAGDHQGASGISWFQGHHRRGVFHDLPAVRLDVPPLRRRPHQAPPTADRRAAARFRPAAHSGVSPSPRPLASVVLTTRTP